MDWVVLLMNSCNEEREGSMDEKGAWNDAMNLCKNQGEWSKDVLFITMLAKRSHTQLLKIFCDFNRMNDGTIQETIEQEFGEAGILSIGIILNVQCFCYFDFDLMKLNEYLFFIFSVNIIESKYFLFVDRISTAMDESDTDAFVRILFCCSERDVNHINKAFYDLKGETIHSYLAVSMPQCLNLSNISHFPPFFIKMIINKFSIFNM